MNPVVQKFILKHIQWRKLEKNGVCSFKSETGTLFEIESIGVGLKVEVTQRGDTERHLLGFM